MFPVILTVYLNDSQQMLTEVPVTAATRVIDVVEYCREVGEGPCHLAEVWAGQERAVPHHILLLDWLNRWGSRRSEVRYYLRHHDHAPYGRQILLDQNQTTVGPDITHDNKVPRVELSLSELQEMATRQQQQIEAQQQMLLAKAESEKLQRLKDRVESQEAKLKKIRAMRGQVDYSKMINGNLSAEIDHVSSLFQEKQAELQSAVVRVDQLTQQLDDLRRGRLQMQPQQTTPLGQEGVELPLGMSGPAALELRKLYQDLQERNRLNAEQSSKLSQNKDLLNKRNVQVTVMDKRIGDLRDRLSKKRAELSRMNGGSPAPAPSPQPPAPPPSGGVSGRVAAVCPYIQLPAGGSMSHSRSTSEVEGCVRKPPSQWKVSDLDILLTETNEKRPRSKTSNEASWPGISRSQSEWRTGSPEQLHHGYGTYPSASHQPAGLHCSTSSLPRCGAAGMLGWHRTNPSSSPPSSSSQQQRILLKGGPGSSPLSQPPQTDRADPPPAAAVRPYVPERPEQPSSRPQSPRKGPATMNSSSIYSMYLQQAPNKQLQQAPNKQLQPPSNKQLQPLSNKNYGSLSNRSTVKAVYGKPVLQSSSASPSPVPFLQGGGGGVKVGEGGVRAGEGGVRVAETVRGEGGVRGKEEGPEREGGVRAGADPPPPSVENIPRPLSPTKLTPVAHSPLRYQEVTSDLEVLRRRLSNAPRPLPRPLKKRSSITEPEGPQGPNIQKLLYQRFNTLAGGMEGGTGNPFYQPGCLLAEMDNIHSANGNVEARDNKEVVMATTEGDAQSHTTTPDLRRLSPPPVAVEMANETPALPPPSPSPPRAGPKRLEDQNNNQTPPPATPPAPSPKVKRTNLKKPSSERTGHGLRVKFNPLALLLDASLEGEFDLVQRIIYEVENPSLPNDEGITPLHNAVCAGHHHIVKFLLDFGVNVNAADSDGWTPLHCAASCNSVHLCKMLVEKGAAIFASTISDVETAADKCEEMEDGFTQCSQLLYGVQEKMGVMNKGVVYALWDYTSQHADELSFSEGDALTVLRRHDDTETEWWWAGLNERQGYAPRNLLGLYPRIKPRQRSLA